MQFAKWADMKLMKKSTNKSKTLKIILQSLPFLSVAIVIVLYLLSFMPLSTTDMTASNTIICHEAHYELTADGKRMFCFKTLSDSLIPENIRCNHSSETTLRTIINGCWVNSLPFIPSCRGTILTTNPDSAQIKRMENAGRNIKGMLNKALQQKEKETKLLARKDEECRYFLKIHNVNDDGFNTIAEYSEKVKTDRKETDSIIAAIKTALKSKHLSLKRIRTYTLLYNKGEAKQCRKACRVITKNKKQPFCLIQTIDKKTPDNAHAIYMHQWLTPDIASGRRILVAAYPDCNLHETAATAIKNNINEGKISQPPYHNMPQIISPDGSPVFTVKGMVMGINMQGKVVSPEYFGFNFKNLR